MQDANPPNPLLVALIVVLVLMSACSSQKILSSSEAYGLPEIEGSKVTPFNPPRLIGNDYATLSARMEPYVIDNNDNKSQNEFLTLRLVHSSSNQTYMHTTYEISLIHLSQDKVVFHDIFHSHDGLLRIKIQPDNEIANASIIGVRNPALRNAVMADQSDFVNIKIPSNFEGGLVRVHTTILGINNDTIIGSGDENAGLASFDNIISIGVSYVNAIQYDNQDYKVTLISYFSKINEFTFDATKKSFSWSVPFNWDVSTDNSGYDLYVHEDMKIPKMFLGISNTHEFTSFNSTINNMPIRKGILSIDPYSLENYLVLHYIVNKDDIDDMARKVPKSMSKMKFTVSIVGNATEQTSSEIATNMGGIHILLDWVPSQLKADTDVSLHMQFIDAFAGDNITNEDVKYDLKILDKDGKEVFLKTDQIARDGIGDQKLNFPRDDDYRIEVSVKGIAKHGLQSPDLTRNGTARGTVVVPEFPTSASTFLAVGTAVGIIILVHRFGIGYSSIGGKAF